MRLSKVTNHVVDTVMVGATDKIDNEIFITIDIDWASDEVLDYTISFFEQENISATFFVTHDTPLLKRLRNNLLFELGLHPNFQKLLNNTSVEKTAREIFDQCKGIVPDAVSVRSHSLVTSSPLLDLYYCNGMKFDVGLFIPWNADMHLIPYYHWNGLLRVPFYFEDDGHCIMMENRQCKNWNVSSLLNRKGIKVFNFHPIHLFLNTENLERYEMMKFGSDGTNKIDAYRFHSEKNGTFVILKNIIKNAKEQGMKFSKIKDIEWNV